jgi:hypothetical protein
VNIASIRFQTDALSGARGAQQLYLHQCDYESLSKQEIQGDDAYGLSRARGLGGGLGGFSMGISTSIGSGPFDTDGLS